VNNQNILIFSLADFAEKFSAPDSAIIFGGTFDPVHQGHIQDIRSLMAVADTVYIAPTEKNPWKEQSPASLEHRTEMIRQALRFEKIPFSENNSNTSGLVLLHTPYIFAYELAETISSRTDKKLFWAIGEDLVPDVSSWKDWNKHGIPFVVLPYLEGTSSTLTRSASIAPHPSITDYIKDKNLY
jgi:cytidyltransferase-like protein